VAAHPPHEEMEAVKTKLDTQSQFLRDLMKLSPREIPKIDLLFHNAKKSWGFIRRIFYQYWTNLRM